ncbi:50S ribosomal protein L9 [Fontisphaera persica]|uniref:50S ribosomal protein L9 n=1 Tax=Fontisphaera persica TaxID=2974023 RepID=UPI0024BFF4AD|nr:50S ribosomal protein L9 [Fontisphaera persica]WCJ58770.1 50S ribosomal protein L9 [Fontisphaera persica]
MAKTEVILTSNIPGLGAESDQVKVAAGYARNFLFPQGLAIPLSAGNKKRLEALRRRRAEREAQEYNTMTELARSLQKLICIITVKTGEDGKMFGNVTSGTIADALKTQFDIALDRKKIHLEKPIHTLGEHEVEMRLHPEVRATLKIRVESATPPPTPAPESAAAEADKRDKKGERAGRKDKADKTDKAEKGPKPEKAEKAK